MDPRQRSKTGTDDTNRGTTPSQAPKSLEDEIESVAAAMNAIRISEHRSRGKEGSDSPEVATRDDNDNLESQTTPQDSCDVEENVLVEDTNPAKTLDNQTLLEDELEPHSEQITNITVTGTTTASTSTAPIDPMFIIKQKEKVQDKAKEAVKDFVSQCKSFAHSEHRLPLKGKSEENAKAMAWIADMLTNKARQYAFLLTVPYEKKDATLKLKKYFEEVNLIQEYQTDELVFTHFKEAETLIKEACMLIIIKGDESTKPGQRLFDWWKEVRDDQKEYNVRYTLEITHDLWLDNLYLGQNVLVKTRRIGHYVTQKVNQDKIDAILGFPPATVEEIELYGAMSQYFYQHMQDWSQLHPTYFRKSFHIYLMWCIKRYHEVKGESIEEAYYYRFPCFHSWSEWQDEHHETYVDCENVEQEHNLVASVQRIESVLNLDNTNTIFGKMLNNKAINWDGKGSTKKSPPSGRKIEQVSEVRDLNTSQDQPQKPTSGKAKQCKKCGKKHKGTCKKPEEQQNTDDPSEADTMKLFAQFQKFMDMQKASKA